MARRNASDADNSNGSDLDPAVDDRRRWKKNFSVSFCIREQVKAVAVRPSCTNVLPIYGGDAVPTPLSKVGRNSEANSPRPPPPLPQSSGLRFNSFKLKSNADLLQDLKSFLFTDLLQDKASTICPYTFINRLTIILLHVTIILFFISTLSALSGLRVTRTATT